MTDVTHVVNVIDYVCVRTGVVSVGPDRCAVGTDRAEGVARPGGRRATQPRRRIVDAILYLNRTGCSWRQLPHDFPPWETVYWYFKTWTDEVSPTAFTSVAGGGARCRRRARWRRAGMSTASGQGRRHRRCPSLGWEAGKGQRAQETHRCRRAGPAHRRAGDRGWRCRRSRWSGPTVATRASWLPGSPGTAGLCSRSCGNPRGSALSRFCRAVGWWNESLCWLVRWRRLHRDYERLPTNSEAVKWAMIGLMARRLAPPPGRRPWQPAHAP